MFAEAFMKKEVLKALNYKDLRSDVFFLLFLKIFSYNTHLFTDFILIQPAKRGLSFCLLIGVIPLFTSHLPPLLAVFFFRSCQFAGVRQSAF